MDYRIGMCCLRRWVRYSLAVICYVVKDTVSPVEFVVSGTPLLYSAVIMVAFVIR